MNDTRLPNPEGLPKIAVQGTEGNNPTSLKGLQVYMAPHVDALMFVWWVLLVIVLSVVFVKNIALPLARQMANKK